MRKDIVWMATVMAGVCWSLTACTGNTGGEVTEDQLSAFGNYVYQIDTLRLEQSLDSLLRSDTAHWQACKTVRERYASQKGLEGTPLWYSRMGVSADADSLLAWLRRELPRNGLDTLQFHVPQIAADLNIVRHLAFDSLGVDINSLLPRLDYRLSQAFVLYTTGQRHGFTRPDLLLNRLQTKPTGEYARLFDDSIPAPDYQAAVESLASERRMEYLRQSEPQGPVYKALRQQISQTADKEQRRRLAVNMERCRWQMPRPAGPGPMVLVNIAAQQLWAVSPDSTLNMKICCGALTSKTPLLSSAISYMQVNPEWVIPFSIVKTDVVRRAGDSAYFARNRYSIVERQTSDTLNPASVTADQLRSGLMRVVQRSGVGNSLGRIVFRFPNDFSVYLHDTNNHGAFSRERRTLSHGCVRVEKPFELACFLLPDADDWKRDCLRISMDLKPVTERGIKYLKEHQDAPRPFRLIGYHDVKPHVPLYIVYYTAYPTPGTGTVETYPDLYGYDKVLLAAMPAE